MFAYAFTSTDVVIALVSVVLGAFVLFVFFEADQAKHEWRKCLLCSEWFDRYGGKVRRNPIPSEKLYGNPEGVCHECEEEQQKAKEPEPSSFLE